MKRTGRTEFRLAFLCALVLLLSPQLVAAQLTTKLRKQEVYTGETVLLEAVIEDAESASPDEIPHIEGVQADFAGTMRKLEIVNGKRASYLVLRYTFRTDTPGEYTIPSFALRVDGERMMTAPKRFTVREGQAQSRQRQNPLSSFDRMFGDTGRRQHRPSFEGVRELSRDICYTGEAVAVRYYLIADRDVEFVLRRFWNNSISGLVTEKIDEHLPDTIVGRNGKSQKKTHVATYVVTPALSGNYTYKGEIASIVHEISSGVFSHGVEQRVRFDTQKIDVLPLPEEGKPDNFSGNIGSYRIALDCPDDNTVTQYGTYSCRVTVRGSGSLHNLAPPAYSARQGLTVSQSETEQNISLRGATYQGDITYTYTVIPERPGEYRVGPFTLNYFDPKQKQYSELSTDSVTLHVTEEGLPADALPDLHTGESGAPGWLPVLAAVLAVVLLSMLFVIQMIHEKRKQRQFREQKAGRKPKDHLSNTDQAHLSLSAVEKLYRHSLQEAVHSGETSRLYKELTRSIDFILTQKKLTPEDTKTVSALQRYLQQLAYGGGSIDVRVLKDIAEKLVSFL